MTRRVVVALLPVIFATFYSNSNLAQTPTVVVTATRTAQTVDSSLAPVTVFTRSDIERYQATSVADVLRVVPGLSLSNNGGPGKTSAVFLRGAESDHTLVLVDGIKIGSATTGAAALSDIPIEQIERIEVVRGPRSSLYGSEAIGGVIQVFTRRGGGVLRPSVSASVGSDQTKKLAANLSGGGERAWFNAGVSGSETEGFNACRAQAATDFGGCFTDEPDRDGYRNVAATLRGGYRFESGSQIDVYTLRSDGHVDYDGGFQNQSDNIQQTFGGRLETSISAAWQVGLSAGRSSDESDNFKDGTFSSRFNTQRDVVSWQNDFSVTQAQLLTLGVDYQKDSVDSTTVYEKTSRDTRAVFAQHQFSLANHDAQISARRDRNEQFGNENTGSLAWGYTFNSKLRATASFGTAFKAPTFNELYFPSFGNPTLQPEKARSVNLGLTSPWNGGRWSINGFQTDIDDLIAYDALIDAPSNVDQARLRGLELELSQRINGWELDLSATLLDAENQSSGSNKGKSLPRRAERSLAADIDRKLGRYRLGGRLFSAGARFDDLANTRKLGGYTTVDLRGEYSVGDAWRLQVRLENIFDKQYETAAFYNQPGRGILLSLHYKPVGKS